MSGNADCREWDNCILFPKIVLTFCEKKKCFTDQEKLLKFKYEGGVFAKKN